jgi:hypothetical protein
MQARNTLWVVFSYYKEISINSKRFKHHEYQIKIIFVNTASKIVVVLNHIWKLDINLKQLENNLIKQLRDLSYASVKIQDCEALLLTYKANFPFQRNHYYCQRVWCDTQSFSQRQCVQRQDATRPCSIN